MARKILMLRAGESIAETSNPVEGQPNYQLTYRGVTEAHSIGNLLKTFSQENVPRYILTSTVSNAVQTAYLIGAMLGFDVEGFKIRQMLELQDIVTKAPLSVISGYPGLEPRFRTEFQAWAEYYQPAWEGLDALQSRLERALYAIERHEEPILVISHDIPIALMFAMNKGVKKDDFVTFYNDWDQLKPGTYKKFCLREALAAT